MFTSTNGLPAAPMDRPSRGVNSQVLPPAAGFMPNGKLNMGPTIVLALTLSLLGWAGLIDAGFRLYHQL